MQPFSHPLSNFLLCSCCQTFSKESSILLGNVSNNKLTNLENKWDIKYQCDYKLQDFNFQFVNALQMGNCPLPIEDRSLPFCMNIMHYKKKKGIVAGNRRKQWILYVWHGRMQDACGHYYCGTVRPFSSPS